MREVGPRKGGESRMPGGLQGGQFFDQQSIKRPQPGDVGLKIERI